MHPTAGDPFAHPLPPKLAEHEIRHPDPAERDFPSSIHDVVEGPPNYEPKEGWSDLSSPREPSEGALDGLERLKRIVREVESDRVLHAGPPLAWIRSAAKQVAGCIADWEAERAGDRENCERLVRQAEAAQERCQRAQDRVAELTVTRWTQFGEIQRLRALLAEAQAHDAATEALASEALEAARIRRGGIEVIREPVGTLPNRRGPMTLSNECVDRVARAVAAMLPTAEVIAEAVSKLLAGDAAQRQEQEPEEGT